MHSFKTGGEAISQLYCHPSLFIRGDDTNRNQTRFSDFGDLHHHHSSAFFQHEDSSNCMFSVKSRNVGMQYGALNTNVGVGEIGRSGGAGKEVIYQQQKVPLGNNSNVVDVESWADSSLADTTSQHEHTDDTSTDIDTDDKNQFNGGKSSKDRTKFRAQDHKTLRRLAQNREAARKSRLRKKAYVQQLENSRVKLLQLEQELQRTRQQGVFIATPGDQPHLPVGNGGLAFDMEYGHWVDEHERMLNELRSALNSEMGDNELHLLVDSVMAHYEELCRLKRIGAKNDVFHMLCGLWKTPVERCFMWLGGFRSSELLKIVKDHLEPLTEHQLIDIYNLEQSSKQSEDAFTQGRDLLYQNLSEALSSTSTSPASGNVADYMGQMTFALTKLATLHEFIHHADQLKLGTLQRLQTILTTRQTARALLVRNDYISRLRALSSLWLARPRE